MLPSFTIDQAASFADHEQAEQVIGWLYKRNFFIDSRAGSATIYRYHDLFRDFLLDRGRSLFPPAQRRTLLMLAAQSAEQSAQPEIALALAIETQVWDEVIRLVCSLAPRVVQQGRTTVLDRWIGSLPRELVSSTPWLLYWQGIACLASDPGPTECVCLFRNGGRHDCRLAGLWRDLA